MHNINFDLLNQKTLSTKREQKLLSDISIDIYKSIEVDLAADKPRKRHKVEDLGDEFNDFFASEEDDLDNVEVDCKLENFFICRKHKDEDPKKLLRKYNSLVEASSNNNFTFENNIQKSTKKSPKFINSIVFLFHQGIYEKQENFTVSDYLDLIILHKSKLYVKVKTKVEANIEQQLNSQEDGIKETDNPYKYTEISGFTELQIDDFINQIKNTLEENFQSLVTIATSLKNYKKGDYKHFEFNNEEFIKISLDFIKNYLRFYHREKISSSLYNKIIMILSKTFPKECTNVSKLKYFITKEIENIARKECFVTSSISEGIFEKQKTENELRNCINSIGKDINKISIDFESKYSLLTTEEDNNLFTTTVEEKSKNNFENN